jgi:hypothetical protein
MTVSGPSLNTTTFRHEDFKGVVAILCLLSESDVRFTDIHNERADTVQCTFDIATSSWRVR